MHMRRLAGDDDEEETVNTSWMMHFEELAQRAKGNQITLASSAVGSVCFSFLCGHFGGGIYFTLLLPLTSSPRSFTLGTAGTYLSLFLFACFTIYQGH